MAKRQLLRVAAFRAGVRLSKGMKNGTVAGTRVQSQAASRVGSVRGSRRNSVARVDHGDHSGVDGDYSTKKKKKKKSKKSRKNTGESEDFEAAGAASEMPSRRASQSQAHQRLSAIGNNHSNDLDLAQLKKSLEQHQAHHPNDPNAPEKYHRLAPVSKCVLACQRCDENCSIFMRTTGPKIAKASKNFMNGFYHILKTLLFADSRRKPKAIKLVFDVIMGLLVGLLFFVFLMFVAGVGDMLDPLADGSENFNVFGDASQILSLKISNGHRTQQTGRPPKFLSVLTNDQLRGIILHAGLFVLSFLFLALLLLKIPSWLVKRPELEHDSGIKEYLFLCGLGSEAYWLSHFLADAVLILFTLIVLFLGVLELPASPQFPLFEILRENCLFHIGGSAAAKTAFLSCFYIWVCSVLLLFYLSPLRAEMRAGERKFYMSAGDKRLLSRVLVWILAKFFQVLGELFGLLAKISHIVFAGIGYGMKWCWERSVGLCRELRSKYRKAKKRNAHDDKLKQRGSGDKELADLESGRPELEDAATHDAAAIEDGPAQPESGSGVEGVPGNGGENVDEDAGKSQDAPPPVAKTVANSTGITFPKESLKANVQRKTSKELLKAKHAKKKSLATAAAAATLGATSAATAASTTTGDDIATSKLTTKHSRKNRTFLASSLSETSIFVLILATLVGVLWSLGIFTFAVPAFNVLDPERAHELRKTLSILLYEPSRHNSGKKTSGGGGPRAIGGSVPMTLHEIEVNLGLLDALKEKHNILFLGTDAKVKSIPNDVIRIWEDIDEDGNDGLTLNAGGGGAFPSIFGGAGNPGVGANGNPNAIKQRLKPDDRIYGLAIKGQQSLPVTESRFIQYYESFVKYVEAIKVAEAVDKAHIAIVQAMSKNVPATSTDTAAATQTNPVSKPKPKPILPTPVKKVDVMQTKVIAYVRRPDRGPNTSSSSLSGSRGAGGSGSLGGNPLSLSAGANRPVGAYPLPGQSGRLNGGGGGSAVGFQEESPLVWNDFGKYYHDPGATNWLSKEEGIPVSFTKGESVEDVYGNGGYLPNAGSGDGYGAVVGSSGGELSEIAQEVIAAQESLKDDLGLEDIEKSQNRKPPKQPVSFYLQRLGMKVLSGIMLAFVPFASLFNILVSVFMHNVVANQGASDILEKRELHRRRAQRRAEKREEARKDAARKMRMVGVVQKVKNRKKRGEAGIE